MKNRKRLLRVGGLFAMLLLLGLFSSFLFFPRSDKSETLPEQEDFSSRLPETKEVSSSITIPPELRKRVIALKSFNKSPEEVDEVFQELAALELKRTDGLSEEEWLAEHQSFQKEWQAYEKRVESEAKDPGFTQEDYDQLVREHVEYQKANAAAKLERDAFKAELETTIASLRARLVFDENGDPIGFKESVTSPSASSPSLPPDDDQIEIHSAKTEGINVSETARDAENGSLDGTSTETFENRLTTQLLFLNAELDAKYIDVVMLPHLSRSDFETLFPTKEARQKLEERQAKMQSEVVDRFGPVFSGISEAKRSEQLSIANKIFSENWSSEFASAVIVKLREYNK